MKTINELTPQAYTKEVREPAKAGPEYQGHDSKEPKFSTKIFTKGNKKYDLELEKVIFKIKKENAKLVLLQFPDGLKPYATSVVDYLEGKINVKFLIWLGNCFGACDTPVLEKDLEKQIDLVIQFGHNEMMPSY